MQILLDGECPKCGGHTSTTDTDEPMTCAQCGHEEPVHPEDVAFFESLAGGD